MHIPPPTPLHRRQNASSLADVLVACVILGMGVAAATSLTLSMNTQEEIAWRVSRGANQLENAAAVFNLGIDASAVPSLLPPDPAVSISAGTEITEDVSGFLLRAATFTATVTSVDDNGSWSAGSWTGGSDGAPVTRTMSARAYRSNHQLRMD